MTQYAEVASKLRDELLQLQRHLAAAKGDYPRSQALQDASNALLQARRAFETAMMPE